MAELIDIQALINSNVFVCGGLATDPYYNGYADALDRVSEVILQLPTVDAVPVSVIKHAISGLSAAIQCDQGGRYEYRLRDALQTVLEWYGSPNYLEHEKRCGDG